ncbi:DNA-binding MarR family transcriptional regulator [Thermocatellispora tengchongensis]|uniref:DNA-binding MarR family transcriptional regulator n=1 Tax=Thermocatellispora tengchongensis TaxID=1073253 RepID=A0A840P2I7_9ACTN|nr:MarR family winged helix-turn-helix transcriptional regulator [Thermocatellispora tengchongensis]MBB5135494.1 DNA-binding MarR family transcriptional regulator [Thermocatellispora tengchongensis]
MAHLERDDDRGGDEPGALSAREERAWNAFFEMQVHFWRQMAQQLQRETGLSEPDLAILTALLNAPGGRLRAYQLSGVTQFEKSRLHHHLTRMAGRGLITREACADTPRGTEIVLTPEGRRAIAAALPRRVAHIRRWLIEPLGEDELEAITRASARILANLRANAPETAYPRPGSSC